MSSTYLVDIAKVNSTVDLTYFKTYSKKGQ